MKRLLDIFYTFSGIEHGSGDTRMALEFLRTFCVSHGAKITVDRAGNLLATVGKPHLCLQAHYDMVAIGVHPPKPQLRSDYITARNGTLGADNGIAVALMLRLIEQEKYGEYLFTNDEEIGLKGANKLEVLPVSPFLINLDSEVEGAVVIGCAGGNDYTLTKQIKHTSVDAERFICHQVSAKNCEGGHSGVDIGKGIRSALAEVCDYTAAHQGQLLSLNGGERANSIAKNATAFAYFPKDIVFARSEYIDCVPSFTQEHIIKNGDRVLSSLVLLPHGVLNYDSQTNTVTQSANFATAKTADNILTVVLSVRGNSKEELEMLEHKAIAVAKLGGFSLQKTAKYPPWRTAKTGFVSFMISRMKEAGFTPEPYIMHAGLECAVLQEKLPNCKMVSIGPTIDFPHSFQERVYVPSVERLFNFISELHVPYQL